MLLTKISQGLPASKTNNIAVISWARPLSKGKQHQVFIRGRRDAAFSTPTMEDVTIIKRLVAVVQHAVPSVPKEARGVGHRAQQRNLFFRSGYAGALFAHRSQVFN